MNWDLFKRQMRKLTALMWASRLDLPEEEQLNLLTSYYNGLNLLYHHDGDEGWFQAASSFANFEVTSGRTDLQKANAWYFYGRALISKGLKTNDSEAFNLSIKVLDQFLRVAPASDAEWRADALVMRSDAYKLKGDTGLAIQDLGEAIRLLPVSEKGKAVKALVARSALHTFKGDDVLAIEDLDEALRLTPNDPDILNSRCYKLAKVGRLELALVDCNKSLDLRPNHAATLDSRGFTYLKMKRVESAINDYDAVLRLDPKSAYSLYGRGVAYLTLGNEDQGNQDIAAAKAIKADIADELARYGVK